MGGKGHSSESPIQAAQDMAHSMDKKLDHLYKQYVPKRLQSGVNVLHERSGLPHYAICLLGVVCLYMMVSRVSELICNLLGFCFPAYKSIKAIESPDRAEVTRWLTYWTVFAALSVFDFFISHLFITIPGYFIFKALFLIWCYIPIERNGSVVMHENVLRPYFLLLEKTFFNSENNNAQRDATRK